jgi:hypothetical protein
MVKRGVPYPLGRPLKQDVARAMLESSWFEAYLDPQRDQVVVPEHLRDKSQLILRVGRSLPTPIPDLVVDDDGFGGTFAFQRTPFHCRVPWASVFALVAEDGNEMVWEDDIPKNIAKTTAVVGSAEWVAWTAEVDAFTGVQVPPLAPGGLYRAASARHDLRGRWLGCFVQLGASLRPLAMDLQLDLRGGKLVGQGVDPLGPFTVTAVSDEEGSGPATLQKEYGDGYPVTYSGVLEGGAMRGLWELGLDRGVFTMCLARDLDSTVLEELAQRSRRARPALDAAFARLGALFRVSARARHARLLDRFRSFGL